MISLLLFRASTTAQYLGDGGKRCPPWFEYVNSSNAHGYCACSVKVPKVISCDQRSQVSLLSQGYCIFYDSRIDRIRASWCPFTFQEGSTRNGLFLLPSNVSELNSVVCGNFSREVKGPLCGRCTNNTGPSIYSVGRSCVPCSPVNILYYLLLQYIPSTLIFLLIIIFKPNITSAPMVNYLLFCNSFRLSIKLNLWTYTQFDSILARAALILSAVWSFDALLFVSPPLCVTHHMQEIYIPFFEVVATAYPFILLLLTYGLIELHAHNFKPVVYLWKLFSKVCEQLFRGWDPRFSLIHAFASILFLSYAKLSYLIWEAFIWSEDINNEGSGRISVLYIDPNTPVYSPKHVLLMTFSVALALLVYLPPLLILVIYPTSLYGIINQYMSQRWRISIKIYVDTFHSCLNDGTNGTRDYRAIWGLYILFRGFLTELLFVIITVTFPRSSTVTSASSYFTSVSFGIVALLFAVVQPYKKRAANTLTVGLLVNSTIICAFVPGLCNTCDLVKKFLLALFLAPHFVLWSYMAWKLMNIVKKCVNKKDCRRHTLLQQH